MAWSSVTLVGGVCGAGCAGPCASAPTAAKSANPWSTIKRRHFRALNFTFIAALLPEKFMSLDATFGEKRIPGAAREIGRDDFEIGQRRHSRRLRRKLRGGRRAWCDLRKDRARGLNNYFQQWQCSDRFENSDAQGSFR